MKYNSRIAVTLFNFREFCKTEDGLASTLDKLCDIGYQVVQVSAVPLDAEIIRKQLDKHGLQCCATHESYKDLTENTLAVADKLDILNCDYTALGSAPVEMRNPEGMAKVGALLNECGAKLKARGKQLGYHNHFFEFAKAGSEKLLYWHLFDATDLCNVVPELDVHWVTRGGGSPVSWIRRFAGKIPVIHFKDFTIVDDAPVFCEIGEGNLDWPEILKACDETGVEVYSIEQDKPFKDRDIFESARISFNNLRAMGVK